MRAVSLVAVLAVVLAIAGCAHKHERYGGPRLQPLEQRTNPQVKVVNGKIVVEPEVLIFAKREGAVTITWKLPADSNLRFAPENGIVIEGELLDQVIRNKDGVAQAQVLDPNQKEIQCEKRAEANGKEFKCKAANSRLMEFKYTIRVYDGDKLLVRDPAGVTGADM
jgi:hypothetical protein